MPHPRHREAMERLTMLRVTSRHSALNASTLMALGGTDIAVASAEAKKTAVSELVVFSAPSAITANMRSRPEPRVITIVRLKPQSQVFRHIDEGSYYFLRDRFHLGASSLDDLVKLVAPQRFAHQFAHSPVFLLGKGLSFFKHGWRQSDGDDFSGSHNS